MGYSYDMLAKNNNISQIKNEYEKTNLQIFIDIKEHGKRVADIALLVGKEIKLNKDELEKLTDSALYHDYGKYYIPHNILLKPSKLTMSEMQTMKKHVYYGSQFAISKFHRKDISNAILYHHENYDGTGYYKVKGEYIPFISRILRVADVYDALTSDRPYRKALDNENAIAVMNSEKCYYDEEIYNMFLNSIKVLEKKR